jgi:hypothetical protein
MKRLFYIALLCLFLAGCGSARKVTTSRQEAGKYTETTTEDKTGNSSLFIDTTKVSGKEIIYTKIEFYPPEPAKQPQPPGPDSLPTEGGPVKHPPNVGPVKSIETLTVTSHDEERGITESESGTDEHRTTDITSEGAVSETTAEEPTADPYRWRYIFGILVAVIAIGAAAYFWLRKAGIFVKVAAFFKRLFI